MEGIKFKEKTERKKKVIRRKEGKNERDIKGKKEKMKEI